VSTLNTIADSNAASSGELAASLAQLSQAADAVNQQASRFRT
jgi:methyl-accepting chemotaxis protein